MNESHSLDPHWNWDEVRTLGGQFVRYVRTSCNHLETVPVEANGVTVAHLCLTCDAQLPSEWTC